MPVGSRSETGRPECDARAVPGHSKASLLRRNRPGVEDTETIETVSAAPSLPAVPVLPLGEFVLRPLRPSDSAPWCRYLSDSRTTEHTSWPEISRAMVGELVDRLIGEYASRASLRWALARASDDKLVGTCGFTRIDADLGAELAYDLAPEYWGRGVMSAAVNSATQWALADGGLRRIEALVMVTNTRSIALLERCGFVRERLLIGHRIARGTPRDFWRYARHSDASGEQPVDAHFGTPQQ